MPNTRRRRFSVQNNIGSRNAPNNKLGKNKTQTSCQTLDDTEIKVVAQNLVAMRSTKSKNMISPITPKNLTLQMVPETSNESNSSTRCIMKKKSTTTVDKDITASISEINVFNILNAAYEAELQQAQEATHPTSVPRDGVETPTGDRGRQNRETPRREKYPRQHRVKVRSPKRRMIIMEEQNKVNDCNKRTVGTSVFHCEQQVQVEIQVQGEEQQEIFNVNDQIEHATSDSDIMETTEEDRPSNHSLDDMCRICHGGDSLSSEVGQLISACTCRGTVGRVHVKCLERWLTESGKSRCELCGTRYATRRVHRYGVPKALVMWLLSQNAKQLMVDSLGIMLMSPLAVLAAWLSGRTLAGLMTQESHVTPWPLASTFVLACMTLVCYYCWIVSAATRHALAWWLWYRSQYEVRLQLQDSED